jgi:hypothetical protein
MSRYPCSNLRRASPSPSRKTRCRVSGGGVERFRVPSAALFVLCRKHAKFGGVTRSTGRRDMLLRYLLEVQHPFCIPDDRRLGCLPRLSSVSLQHYPTLRSIILFLLKVRSSDRGRRMVISSSCSGSRFVNLISGGAAGTRGSGCSKPPTLHHNVAPSDALCFRAWQAAKTALRFDRRRVESGLEHPKGAWNVWSQTVEEEKSIEISDATFGEFALPSRSSAEQLRVRDRKLALSISLISASRRTPSLFVGLVRNSQARELLGRYNSEMMRKNAENKQRRIPQPGLW